MSGMWPSVAEVGSGAKKRAQGHDRDMNISIFQTRMQSLT